MIKEEDIKYEWLVKFENMFEYKIIQLWSSLSGIES